MTRSALHRIRGHGSTICHSASHWPSIKLSNIAVMDGRSRRANVRMCCVFHHRTPTCLVVCLSVCRLATNDDDDGGPLLLLLHPCQRRLTCALFWFSLRVSVCPRCTGSCFFCNNAKMQDKNTGCRCCDALNAPIYALELQFNDVERTQFVWCALRWRDLNDESGDELEVIELFYFCLTYFLLFIFSLYSLTSFLRIQFS